MSAVLRHAERQRPRRRRYPDRRGRRAAGFLLGVAAQSFRGSQPAAATYGERDGKAVMRGELALTPKMWSSGESPQVADARSSRTCLSSASGFIVSSSRMARWYAVPARAGRLRGVSPVYRGAGIDTHLLSVKYLGHITATPEQYQSLKGPLTEMLNLTKERRASQ